MEDGSGYAGEHGRKMARQTNARVFEHCKQAAAVESKKVLPTLFVRYGGGLGAL